MGRTRTLRGDRSVMVRLLAILCMLWLMGCQSKPSISLWVLDAENGSRITRATVTLDDQPLRTDSEGRFSVPVEEGSYQVEVSARGYLARSVTETVAEGETDERHGVALERRTLRGTIYDDITGDPVAGAQVQFGDALAITDQDGRFEIEAFTQTSLLIVAPGYLPGELAQNEVEALFTPSGEMTSELNIAVMPRVLIGTVTEVGTGLPISGTLVSVGNREGYSDAEGHYQVTHVVSGTSIAFSSVAHRPVEGLPYEGQEVQDTPLEAWEVNLIVKDPVTKEPVSGARISVGGPITPTETITHTDEQGRAVLHMLPKTPLTIELEKYRTTHVVYGGEETLEVTLQPSWMKAQLRDGDTGEPISGTMVQALFEGEDGPTLLRTDEGGHFEFLDALDLITLTLKAPGYRLLSMPVTRTGEVHVDLEPFEARGIYIPMGLLALPDRIEQLLNLVEGSEVLNAVVVDVKGDDAWIAWPSENPVAVEADAYWEELMDLRVFLDDCHHRGIYVIARMVVFKDTRLAKTRREWAVVRPDGSYYVDWEGLYWVDPFRQEVRDYNISLVKEIVDMGFDEVQFDYLRFPSDGRTRDLVYQQEANLETRPAAIAEFCAQAHDALSPTQAFVSADIFGLTPWVSPSSDKVDLLIGQTIDDIAPHVDYLSPMLYPSTFIQGNLGLANPSLHPYEVIYRSVVKAQERVSTKTRPWLQHYSSRGIVYGPVELLKQRRGAEDAQSCGWLYWNAGGRYEPEIFSAEAYERYPEAVPSPTPSPTSPEEGDED